MEITEYKERKEAIAKERHRLTIEFSELNKEYIKSNSVFKEGDKIEVEDKFGRKVIGYFSYYKIDYNDKVVPVLHQSKKDGTISKKILQSYDYKNGTEKLIN